MEFRGCPVLIGTHAHWWRCGLPATHVRDRGDRDDGRAIMVCSSHAGYSGKLPLGRLDMIPGRSDTHQGRE